MLAYRFDQVFRKGAQHKEYEKWIFERLKDEIKSVSKIEYSSPQIRMHHMKIWCGSIFNVTYEVSNDQMHEFDDEDYIYSILKHLTRAISEAEPDDFISTSD